MNGRTDGQKDIWISGGTDIHISNNRRNINKKALIKCIVFVINTNTHTHSHTLRHPGWLTRQAVSQSIR